MFYSQAYTIEVFYIQIITEKFLKKRLLKDWFKRRSCNIVYLKKDFIRSLGKLKVNFNISVINVIKCKELMTE